MTPGRPVVRWVGLLSAVLATGLAGGCASSQPRMHRALDASMERLMRTERYLLDVGGITGNAARLMRGDGFVYISDLAPQLQYLAVAGDTARYRSLRAFVQQNMVRREATGLMPVRRFRADAPYEKATPYGYHWLSQALADGWRLLGDTASAQLAAQVVWSTESSTQAFDASYQFTMRCADAHDALPQDPAPARAVLRAADKELRTLGIRGTEVELDVLSCLTRVALGAQDPDASVRHLDRILDIIAPYILHSARPDAGTSADVLMTLRQARLAGPQYYAAPPSRAGR